MINRQSSRTHRPMLQVTFDGRRMGSSCMRSMTIKIIQVTVYLFLVNYLDVPDDGESMWPEELARYFKIFPI